MSRSSAPQKNQLIQFWHSVAEVAGSAASESNLKSVDSSDELLPYLRVLVADTSVLMAELIPALESSLASQGLVLAPLLRIRLLFAQSWFDAYMAQLNLDPDILDSACALRSAFIVRALHDDALFVDVDNVFARLLQVLAVQLPVWYAGQGRVAERFPQALDTLMQELDVAGGELAELPITSFLQWVEKELERAAVQRERCIERERSESQVEGLAARVRQYYRDKVVGLSLPVFVDEYVRVQLLAELQFVLINHGDKHDSWILWQRLLALLPRIYDVNAGRSKSLLYADVQQAVALLEAPMIILSASQAGYDEFVQALLASLFTVLQGSEVEVETVLSLAEAEPAVGVRTQISRSLLRRVAMVREGDWFLFEAEGGDIIRCQLALKLLDPQSLIFVNRAGVKVLQKGLDEFALCLSSRVAVPLAVEPIFEACSVRAVNVLRELYDANLDSHRAEQQRTQALAAADKKLRVQAAAKARSEALLLAEQRRQQQAEVDQCRRAEALQVVDALTVGSWLELPSEGGDAAELIRAKLAVVIPSTGKHIFVDRIGMKLAEYQREELVDMLQQCQANVVSCEDSFESQLSKIVQGLRKKY